MSVNIPGGQMEVERGDGVLEQALANFRESVHAWGEAEFGRPRALVAPRSRRIPLRLAAAWTLGCVLAAGGVWGVVYEHNQRQVRIAAALQVEHQRQLAAEQAREDEELAQVDSEISREVPSAMEPLVQLMDDAESK